MYFSCRIALVNIICWSWCSLVNGAVSSGPTRGRLPSGLLMESISHSLVRNTPVVCWRSFWRAVLLLFLLLKGADTCCWVDALLRSPGVSRCLLVSPGVSWCLLASPGVSSRLCARRHKLSRDHRYGCVLLEELHYLCSLMELQVAPHAAVVRRSRTQKEKESGGEQRAAVCGHHTNNTPCLGLVLLLPPLNLLLLWFAPKQKRIHSHWFF